MLGRWWDNGGHTAWASFSQFSVVEIFTLDRIFLYILLLRAHFHLQMSLKYFSVNRCLLLQCKSFTEWLLLNCYSHTFIKRPYLYMLQCTTLNLKLTPNSILPTPSRTPHPMTMKCVFGRRQSFSQFQGLTLLIWFRTFHASAYVLSVSNFQV